MPDKALARLHRVTDLFENGRELVLQDDGGEPVVLWIAKLNTFQRGEAQRDGQAARARREAALTEDSDEIRAVLTRLSGMTRDEVTTYLIESQRPEARLAARDDVLAEPEWYERRGLLERAYSLQDANPPTEEEAAQLEQLEEEFGAAIGEATDKRLAEVRDELDELELEALNRRYIDVWRDNVGANALYQEFQRAELYYSIRDCSATRRPDGYYDHGSCTHQRLLTSRAAVNELPQELLTRVQRVMQQMNMAPSDAGFSDAPESSSASSEQPSSAEVSTPSTQEETQLQPAGT